MAITATMIIIAGAIHKELHWFLGCWRQGGLWGDVLEGRRQVKKDFNIDSHSPCLSI